jgi:hypothetical protein
MKTPRELILERHQSAEAKLKAIRAEDLAACARSAAVSSSDREPGRLAAYRKTPGRSGIQNTRESWGPLRAGTARGPGSLRQPWLDVWSAAARFWEEVFWPWRRAWIGMAAIWLVILAFSLAAHETPRTASTRPARPDPEALAVLREQKQLLTQLLGPGAPPLVSRLRTPGPRSEAEPPPRRGEGAGRRETTLREEAFAQA